MNEEIESATYFDDRIYKIKKDGVEHFIASVTTKLGVERKPFLETWRGEVGNDFANKKMNEAGERGKRIHYALQIYLAGGIVVYNNWQAPIYVDEQLEALKKESNGLFFVLRNQDEMVDLWKLQRFFDIVKPKVVASEKIVYSVEDDIAGTLDMALEIQAGTYAVSGSKGLVIPETGLWIVDLKSGKTVDMGMFRQIAPYAYAFKKMRLGDPVGGLILHTQSSNSKGIDGFGVKVCGKDDLKDYLSDYFHLSAVWKRNNPNFEPVAFQFPSLIRGIKESQ